MLVYLDMQKGKPKSKIEVRSFSGYTLKHRYRREDRRDILINALVNKSDPITRGYRWFSVVPKANNLIFQLAEQIGPRLGNFVGGVLNALSRPFNILIRVLYNQKMVWTGSPNLFWKTTIAIVGLVYKQAYLALTKKGKHTPEQADALARGAARIFCNFMLTTRLGYQLALYQYGIEKPEESEAIEEEPLSETERQAVEELDEEVASELGGMDTSTAMSLQVVTRQVVKAFRRLRLNQILDRLEPSSYQRIAYAFLVNSQGGDVSVRWTLYAKGTHAYTSIITAITDLIVSQVRQVGDMGVPMAGGVRVAALRKLRSRSFSYDMEYEDDMEKEEYLGKKHKKNRKDEMEELYSDDDYMYDETYEDEYVGEDEYTEGEYDEGEVTEEYDYDEEEVNYEDEYGDEYEEYDENEYEYEDEYDDEYEMDDVEEPDLLVTDLEPETSDYELPEYGESTQIEPVYDEDEEESQLVETLKSIEPSLSAFRLADKFLRTRTFSKGLELKRKFYDFLVNEFINTRAFNKKEEKEMEEAAAEIVDKLDTLAEDVKDMRTMLAKAIEAMDVATADEGSEGDEESDDSGSSWDDFWRSDDSNETVDNEEEEKESESDEEEDDESSDEAESDEEGEDKKEYRGYYARLRRYKKRGLRTPKKAAKPTKKPKAKGI